MNKINALIIAPEDDVVVAIEPIAKGQEVIWSDKQSVIATTDIPIYHKVAINDLKKGDKVKKYGEHIGEAIVDIKKGDHVHVHNVQGVRENLDNK